MEKINEIRNTILKLKKPSYLTTNKKEVRVRCPYCGDSKDPNSAHLYISMKPPFMFHCFKCETSGALNAKSLKDFSIHDPNLLLNILEVNKTKNAYSQITSGFSTINKKTLNKENNFSIKEMTENKALEYFNRRFDVSLEPDYISKKFNAILNPIQFAKNNYVNLPLTFDYSSAIGFISADESHLVFRDIGGVQERRYNNLNLYPDNDSPVSKMYNIKTTIDIMEKEVTLVIAEGIFDIIGVYLAFYKDTEKEKNTIFAAACGKGYNAVIAHYVRMGFLNLNVIIYSDGDVNIRFYQELKKASPYIKNKPITIFYNSLYDPKTKFGKDFGVPKSQIQLRKAII